MLEFERIFRTQQNTLEQFPGFLAGLWMFCIFVHAQIGAILGLFWVVTRVLFARWYLNNPEERIKATIPGYLLTLGKIAHDSIIHGYLLSPGYLVVIIFHLGVAIKALWSLLESVKW